MLPPKIKIIKLGSCSLEAQELPSMMTRKIKMDIGIGGGSNVILIEEANRRTLIDTGFDREELGRSPDNIEQNRQSLISALRFHGYSIKDINRVFITHWHLDHYGSLDLFEGAERLASRVLVERLEAKDFTPVNDGQEIDDGVKVVFTPGHTIDHASILVDSNTILKSSHQSMKGISYRIAIAGDAVTSLSYLDKEKIWMYNSDFYSKEEAINSMKKLATDADLIIPGHGTPFFTNFWRRRRKAKQP